MDFREKDSLGVDGVVQGGIHRALFVVAAAACLERSNNFNMFDCPGDRRLLKFLELLK